jgi:hypothetical protein
MAPERTRHKCLDCEHADRLRCRAHGCSRAEDVGTECAAVSDVRVTDRMTRTPTPSPTPTPVTTPPPTLAPPPTLTLETIPAYDGVNLAYAISAAQNAGETPYDVGGGLLGIIVPSDWTVCFFAVDGGSVTLYAAKSCAADPNSRRGAEPSTAVIGTLVGEDLQTAETTLMAGRYGYAEIGGGGLGILDPEDWTVCHATVASARAQLFAAKNCSSALASG